MTEKAAQNGRDARAADEREDTGQSTVGSNDVWLDALVRQAAHVSGAGHPPVLPRIGQVIGDKYRVEACIGRGGMGAVYRASHVLTEKAVAIKWMLRSSADAAAHRRFLREALAASRIDHPNVVDVYDVGEHASCTYLVMELLHGDALSARLAHGRIGWREAVSLLLPAMRGVIAAHRVGVIHRDLKPDNIFLCRGADGSPRDAKVLDFGVASVRSSSTVEPTLTAHGTVLGTPAYMSPEQLTGARDVDERTDVYAFGVILYEALTGRRPFQAASYAGLVLAISNERPLPPTELCNDVPHALEAIVLRALSKAREERYDSVDQLVAALSAVLQAHGPEPMPISSTVPALVMHSPRATATVPQRAATALSGRRSILAVLAALACLAVQIELWLSADIGLDPVEHAKQSARLAQPPAAKRAYAAPPPLDMLEVKASPAAVSGPRVVASSFVPRSCEELRRAGQSHDGEVQIDPDGTGPSAAFDVFCAGMSGSEAREYLTLPHGLVSGEPHRNVTHFVYAGGACKCPPLTLHFSRVRLHPQSMSIDPGDTSFAAYNRSLSCEMEQRSHCGESRALIWGGAGGCYGTGGSASIDLRGTPFALAPSVRFVPAGFAASGNAVISDDRKTAELTGGGRCGVVVAEQGSIALVADR